MSYFDHPFISNSDFNKLGVMTGIDKEKPVNIEAIYQLGTIFHTGILQRHLLTDADRYHPDFPNTKRMANTFFKDPICRMIISRHDFKAEREFYNDCVEVGGMRYKGRAKADGDSEGISTILEIKGLGVTSQAAFEEAILNFNYDRAAVHYMLVAKRKMMLIAGISKKKDMLFKKIVKPHDEFYAWGEQKLIDRLKLLRSLSPDDVQLL